MLRRLLSLLLILSLFSLELSFALAEPVQQVIPLEDVASGEVVDTGFQPLKLGDQDGADSTDIVVLQNRLIQLGYLRDSADGVFGENTEKAVRALQRSNNMEETGEVTVSLLDLLYSGANVVPFAASTDPESMTYRVQEKLGLWGFMVSNPDGIAGSKTNDAVAAFKQYLRGGYLKNHPTPKPEPTATPEPGAAMPLAIDSPIDTSADTEITQDVLDFVDGVYPFEVFAGELRNGMKGAEVLRLQRRLHLLKYLAVVDGIYGTSTERALSYFQRKNGLPETAVADEATQRKLYSENAIRAEEYVNEYKLVVDVSDQRVYVYQWDGDNYDTLMGEMICSTGKKGKGTETPLGTYQAAGITSKDEWYWFEEYSCYARYAYRIIGGILFHSVIYSSGKVLNKTSVKKLGTPASHGCIRLKVEHAKWIFENCPSGTTVVIQE